MHVLVAFLSRCTLRRARCLLLGPGVIGSIFLIAVLKSLVKDADALDAVACLLLSLELEAHLHFVVLLSLVGKLVWDIRVLIVSAQNGVASLGRVACLATSLFVVLDRFVVVGVVFAELRNPEVECYYFGTAFPGRDLDEIVHEEPGLNEGEGLAEADGGELRDDDGCDAWVLAVVAVDAVAHDRSCGASRCSLALRLRRLYHLLVLYQLLKMTRCQSLHVVYHNVIWRLQSIDFDDPLHFIVPALVRLLLLDTVAQVV